MVSIRCHYYPGNFLAENFVHILMFWKFPPSHTNASPCTFPLNLFACIFRPKATFKKLFVFKLFKQKSCRIVQWTIIYLHLDSSVVNILSYLLTCSCVLSFLHTYLHTHTPISCPLSICRAEMIHTPWVHWIIKSLWPCLTCLRYSHSPGYSVSHPIQAPASPSWVANNKNVLSTCVQKENHFVTLCVLHLGNSKVTGPSSQTL